MMQLCPLIPTLCEWSSIPSLELNMLAELLLSVRGQRVAVSDVCLAAASVVLW
jgi:hypothetical protein